jgi:hypothetical protein
MDSSFERRFLSLCTLAACEKTCIRGNRAGRACHRPMQTMTCARRELRKPAPLRRASV